MRTARILLTVAMMLCAAAVSDAQKLVILHTNDTHSQIEPVRVGRAKGTGGVERRLQYINGIRKEYGRRKVLLLDAGDYNQGTPYFTVARGDLEVELMNAMKYDVATLGNHEFDNGKEELARRLKMARHKTITCNYDFSATCLKKYIKPYVIVRRGGMKIGIIGTTSYLEGNVMKEHTDGLVRLDGIERVNYYADLLKNRKHCDLVILLSHFGFDGGSYDKPSDVIMVQNSHNLDLVIGGHSHTFLNEARIEKDLDGREIPIVQTGSQGIVVGRFDIY
ncbi:MAG: bifunctional metallophosphatase/5'-nucleotidase [Bacteroidales bacterium]|nr:bifunctional metallophosphatase/5'-nucleotidase [Bacteroidales bacterium]